MRIHSIARQLCAVAVAALALSGCTGLNAAAPTIPSGASIGEYYDNDFAVGMNLAARPRDAMLVGIQYVDDNCATYFDSLVEIDRRAAMAQSVALTGATQVQVLMALAEKSAMAVARVAAATEITKVLFEQYREKFTFAPHTVELRSIVFDALKKEKDQLINTTPASEIEAVMAVKHYAQNCTIATIQEQWNRSMAKAVAGGVKPATRGGSGGGGQAEGVGFYRSPLSTDRFVVR